MFFGKAKFMNKRWVNHHILDTLLKSLFKFVLSLGYAFLGYAAMTYMVGSLEPGESLPGSINDEPHRRARNGGALIVVMSSIFLFLPYIMVFAGLINISKSIYFGYTPFEYKTMKKFFIDQYLIEQERAQNENRAMHVAFSDRKTWISHGCPSADQVSIR